MSAMLLAAGISDGHTAAGGVQHVTSERLAAVVTTPSGLPLAPRPVAVERVDADHAHDHAVATPHGSVTPPHLGERAMSGWDTSTHNPDSDAHQWTHGQRGPPRR